MAPTRQLLSQTAYDTDGVTTVWNFSMAGGYISTDHVKAARRDKITSVTTQIPVTTANFVGPYQLRFSPAIEAGVELIIYRDTPKSLPIVDFADRGSLTETSLDTNAKQAVFLAAEYADHLAAQGLNLSYLPSSTAGGIASIPAGNLAATTVQAALYELAAEKASVTDLAVLQERLDEEVHVDAFLTAGQRMNAFLRLGTVDCGPQLQLAINAAANRKLMWRAGSIYGCSQELIVRSAQVWQGGGKGQMLIPFSSQTTPITQLVTLGDGTAYKTIKTRVKYRGSAGDAQDAPISALVNVQHPAFEIHDMSIKCNYAYTTLMTTQNYLGDNWDVGIFIGCRVHAKISSVAVIGNWRVAAIYADVTRSAGWPELYGWDGIQHPTFGPHGADGCSLSDVTVWGGKWGMLVKGAAPKPTYGSYGIDYVNSLSATIGTLPVEGDTVTFGEVTFTFAASPASSFEVDIGGTVAAAATNLAAACEALVEETSSYPVFRSAIFLSNGNVVTTLFRNEASQEYAVTFTAATASGGRITFSTAAKRWSVKVLTVPVDGETVTLGGVVFTFRVTPALTTDVAIAATINLTATNLQTACNAVLAGAGAYPIFRSATYALHRSTVSTLPVTAQLAYYTANYTASSAAASMSVVQDLTAPSVITDPAPYYDEAQGSAVTDRRGAFGFSDFSIKDSQLYGSAHPMGWARQAIRADKNWLIDDAGGSFYIDGLAGNGSRLLQGHRYENVRFDGKYDAFNVRLGRTQRDDFYSCHWDGTGVTGFTYPDGSTASLVALDVKYGSITNVPQVTRRTRFFGRDTTPYSQYFKMWDAGSANVADVGGRMQLTGNLTVNNGRFISDKSSYFNGYASFTANGGASGGGRYEFMAEGVTQGGLRYYNFTKNMRLALNGNVNTVLWQNDVVAKTATQTLTPVDSTGMGIYTSDGSVRLSAANGDAEVWAGPGGKVVLRSLATTLMSVSPTVTFLTSTAEFRPSSDGVVLNGKSNLRWGNTHTVILTLGAGITHSVGSGSPEGTVSAAIGSAYWDTTNGVQYNKKSGAGNTGWKLVTQAA